MAEIADNHLLNQQHHIHMKQMPGDSTRLCDCTFIIENQELHAHKTILAGSSPVFDKMFFGQMPCSQKIPITDATLSDFQKVLEFIYSQTIDIESVLNAWSIFYVAHKYLLTDLMRCCAEFIKNNLALSNLVLSYEYSEMFGCDDLQNKCLLNIVRYVKGIFAPEYYYHMKSSTLLTILEEDMLNIEDADLFQGVCKWACGVCDAKKVLQTPENLVNILAESGFTRYLSRLKIKDVWKCDKLVHETWDFFFDSKHFEHQTKMYHQFIWTTFCKTRHLLKIARRVNLAERETLRTQICVNRKIALFGLVLGVEDKLFYNQKSCYNGAIDVVIKADDDDRARCSITNFTGSLNYNTPCYVPLKDVVTFEAERSYSILIQYGNLDGVFDNSILCFYMSGGVKDSKNGAVFQFSERCGGVIMAFSYYPV